MKPGKTSMNSGTNPDAAPTEVQFYVRLPGRARPSRAWLETTAIEVEETLIRQAAGLALGPAVAANFQENSFELDVTVEASSLAEAYGKLSRIMVIVDETMDVRLDMSATHQICATVSSVVPSATGS